MPNTRMRSLLAIAVIIASHPAAFAARPASLHQLGHTSWTLRDGALHAYPRAIAQTADRYLWLGTDSGLLRFDGLRFVELADKLRGLLPSQVITSLRASRDGALWIGTAQGLARLRNGAVVKFREFDGTFVASLIEARDGAVWVGTNGITGNARLCRIRGESVKCSETGSALGRSILSIYEDRAGNIWVGSSTGLWLWSEPTPVRYPVPDAPQEIHAVVDSGNSTLMISVNREILTFRDGQFEVRPIGAEPLKPTALLQSSDGSTWVGTQNRGLIQLTAMLQESYRKTDGLSGDFITSLLEDSEGNVWVGTLGGLDRFRPVLASRVSTKQGLSSDAVTSIHGDSTGGIWIGTVGGLDRWKAGTVSHFTIPGISALEGVGSLLEDSQQRLWVTSLDGIYYMRPPYTRVERVPGLTTRHSHALVEDAGGNVWISDQTAGLICITTSGVVLEYPWSQLGGREARTLAADPSGGIWLGFLTGEIGLFRNGRLERVVGAEHRLRGGRVNDLHVARDGSVWVASENGLSRLQGETVNALDRLEGSRCAPVQWVIEDRSGSIWLHTPCGIARLLPQQIDGGTAVGVRQISQFTTDDGVFRYSDLGGYGPKVTEAADGQLWFATYDGAAVIDPSGVSSTPRATPAMIERAVVDRTPVEIADHLQLPPLVRDITIEYTAMTLVAPEKARFRYHLDGRDREWIDAAGRRQAFYTDLGPGTYRFQVAASDGFGDWSAQPATWVFTIRPTFYQTLAFRAFIIGLALLAFYGFYRLRLRRLRVELSMRFEERLTERTRIAQALHDTLLQGFISSSMQLQVLAQQIDDQTLRPALDRIIDRIATILDEGRQTVSGLRGAVADELEAALVRDAEWLRGTLPIEIRAIVDGQRRALKPTLRDAAYQIGREALANACRHSKASRIEIDITYSYHALTVIIRDNGIGIPSDVVDSGRPGHWGLGGMRDRAEEAGGTLTVLSRAEAGTEVQLVLPTSERPRRWWSILRRP